MKVPINWIKDYIDFSSEEELMDKLTSIGHMQDGPPVKIGGANVYDLEVRQNRPDCLSLVGIAREAGAVLNKKIKDPTQNLQNLPSVKAQTKVDIQDSHLCYRFNTVTVEGIKVGESPQWLKDKLSAYGIKSVNNIVDITNFVMVELGQPLHGFDKDKIKDRILIIRSAKKGETLTLLGGKKLELTEDDLVIADPDKAVALAGVMGGEETSVSGSTASIILEAATYNQATVRRSSLRHTVRTEASTRLEKFLHPHLTEVALQRAASMILKLCGGKVVDTTDEYPKKYQDLKVTIDVTHLNALGGVNLNIVEAQEYLHRLELPNKSTSQDSIEVEIPYFRTDLELEEDLIEEVLRIYGYGNIPAHLPASAPPQSIDSKVYLLEEQMRDLLTAAGLDEQITEPLRKEENPASTPVLLENSLNADKTMLRTTLKNSLYAALLNQQKFRKQEIKLFEIGKIYFREGEEYKETPVLGVITRGINYFDAKGVYELLLDRFDTDLRLQDLNIEILDDDLYFWEIELEKIKEAKIIKPLSEPPHVILQDVSLFVSKNTKVGELIEGVKATSSLLTKVELGEEPQEKGEQKTVFLNLEFSSTRKNLTKEEVDSEKKKIIKVLEEKFQAKVR